MAVEKYVRRHERLSREVRDVATKPRLPYSAIDGGTLVVKDDYDNPQAYIGEQWDGTHTVASVGGPPPPSPTIPLVTPVAGGLNIYWDGTFVDELPTRMTWRRTTIHAVTDVDAFDPLDPGQIVGSISIATGGEVFASLPPVEHFVFAVAWSDSGKFSVESDAAFGTPLEIIDPVLWAEHEAELDALNALQLPQLATDLAANKTAVDTLTMTTIPGLQSNLSALSGTVSGNSSAISTLNLTTIPGLQSSLTTLSGTVSGNSSAINTLNTTTLPGLQSTLNGLNSTITDWKTAGQTTIDGGKITTDSVTALQIAAGTVTAAEIAAGTITAAQIAANTITAAKIAAGTITATEIAANTITAAKIAAGTITASEIAANTITAAKIAADTITATEIAAGAITVSELGAGAVTTAKLDAFAVTAAKIAANTITAAQIAAGTITATEIAANTITANKIAADTITANEIATGAITATEIATGAITAGKLAADAITGKTIVGGTIDGVTITGGVFRTVTSGKRMEIGTAADASRVQFFSGDADEAIAPYVAANRPAELYMNSGTRTSAPAGTGNNAPTAGISLYGSSSVERSTMNTFAQVVDIGGYKADLYIGGDLTGLLSTAGVCLRNYSSATAGGNDKPDFIIATTREMRLNGTKITLYADTVTTKSDVTATTVSATGSGWTGTVTYTRWGRVMQVSIALLKTSWATNEVVVAGAIPAAHRPSGSPIFAGSNASGDNTYRNWWINGSTGDVNVANSGTGSVHATITYLTAS